VCTYVMTALISTKPQQWDPLTPTAFKDVGPPPSVFPNVTYTDLTNQNEFTIYHMPSGSNDVSAPYSVSYLLKATTDSTLYLASLGHNVVVNQQTEQLYVLYDTVELKDALKVPLALVIVLGVMVLVGIVAWGYSEKYTPVLNGSLYKVIYQRVQSEDKEKAMLMDCTHGPLAFESYKVILDFDENLTRSSQEDAADNRNTQSSQSTLLIPMVPLYNQQAAARDVVQSPLAINKGPVAYNPVMTPPASSSIPTSPAVVSSAVPYLYSGSTSSSVQTIGQGHPPLNPTRRPKINGRLSHYSATNSVHSSLYSVSSPDANERSTSSSPPRS
jgi:hypothetical protein